MKVDVLCKLAYSLVAFFGNDRYYLLFNNNDAFLKKFKKSGARAFCAAHFVGKRDKLNIGLRDACVDITVFWSLPGQDLGDEKQLFSEIRRLSKAFIILVKKHDEEDVLENHLITRKWEYTDVFSDCLTAMINEEDLGVKVYAIPGYKQLNPHLFSEPKAAK